MSNSKRISMTKEESDLRAKALHDKTQEIIRKLQHDKLNRSKISPREHFRLAMSIDAKVALREVEANKKSSETPN